MPFPLSVVITTFNRRDALEQCLRHLEQQTWRDFEVVLVDDGSTDGTPAFIQSYAAQTPLSFRHLRQPNGGPSRARNAAIAVVDAPVTLLLGDDIFATPDLTAIHLELHRNRPDLAVVGLGLTRWAQHGQQVTPFMRWLEDDGIQFNYGELLRGTPPDWRHFYTSNLSLKTALLRRFPFHEGFPAVALEDIELACQIEAALPLEMVFLPDALAYHLHPTSFEQSCSRMRRVGEAAAYFHQLWPEKLPRGEKSLQYRIGGRIAQASGMLPLLQQIAAASLRFACPNPLMSFVLNHNFDLGYERSGARQAKPQLQTRSA